MNRRAFFSFLAGAAAAATLKLPITAPFRAVAIDRLYQQHALYAQLTAVTRKAFAPRLFVQVYTASPIMHAILRAENDSDPHG